MKTDTKIFFTGFSFSILLLMTLGQECDKAFQSTCKDRGGCYCPEHKGCIVIPKDYTLYYNETEAACANVGASLFKFSPPISRTIDECLTACEKPLVYDYVFCLQPQLPYYECPCLHVTRPLYNTFNDDCDGPQIKNITNICLIPC
ncbi:UNVERIFIED_CONTAM: hypothetical protein RMT77_011132 [Armadillidium vulgare]